LLLHPALDPLATPRYLLSRPFQPQQLRHLTEQSAIAAQPWLADGSALTSFSAILRSLRQIPELGVPIPFDLV